MAFAWTILLFVSILAITADAFLFAGALTRLTSIISFAVAGAGTYVLVRHINPQHPEPKSAAPRPPLELTLLFTLSSLTFFQLLINHPITVAVRTPWTALPPELFICFGLMVFSGFAGTTLSLRHHILTFAYLGIPTMAFPLGYGFDSFLHRAAELAIVATGSIDPMPILYGGQYALITALHFVTGITVDALDIFLVPTLVALTLPALIRHPAVIFLLPLSLFAVSTPFAFATYLFLAVVLLCTCAPSSSRALPLIIALAACSIHLVAGIPALVIVGLEQLKHPKHLALGAILGSLLVPLAFIMKLALSGAPITLSFSLPFALPSLPATTFRFFQDSAYLLGAGLVVLLIVFLIRGLTLCTEDSRLNYLLAGAGAFMLSGILLSMITLPDVIAYEQGDYARRLLLLGTLALSPFVILGVEEFLKRVAGHTTQQPLALLTITLLAVSHFYLLSPRADRHTTSKGFNVTQADMDAANVIAADAALQPYFILAPQTTSAAFVRTLGFPNDDRTLPIPTGGALYGYFLDATERLDATAMPRAMTFSHRKLGYFLLPTWWWRFDDIKARLDPIASGHFFVRDVSVWKFEAK